MDKKTPYRNALRSKKMIQDAFLALMLKKDIMKIKTQEVIELACVSKGTFYAHFPCLFDVQHEIENDYLKRMFCIFEGRTNELLIEEFYPLFLCGLEEMSRNRELFTKFLGNGYGDSFLRKLKATFLSYMLSSAAVTAYFKSPESARAYFTYVAGGSIALIQNWLEGTPQVSPEVMAKFLSDCALKGINGIKDGTLWDG